MTWTAPQYGPITPKAWHRSRTIRAALVGLLAFLVNALGGWVEDPQAVSWGAVAFGALMVGLRCVTRDPLEKL